MTRHGMRVLCVLTMVWCPIAAPAAPAEDDSLLSVSFESGFGALTPVTGRWRVDAGTAREDSDSTDSKGRPLFATFEGVAEDDFAVTVEFRNNDYAGETLVCPVWTDADNYVAAVWVDGNRIRLLHVRQGSETVLAEARVDGISPPVRLGAAVSGQGLRAYLNGEQVLEAAAFFTPGHVRALGGRFRDVGFHRVVETSVTPWVTNPMTASPVVIEPVPGRRAFYRMERNAAMTVAVRNLSDQSLEQVRVETVVNGFPDYSSVRVIETLAANGAVTVALAVPAERLRPDDYQVSVNVEAPGWRPAQAAFPFAVVKRPLPQRLDVLLWGSVPEVWLPRLAELGFTAVYGAAADYKYLWDNPQATDSHDFSDPARKQALLDHLEAIMRCGMVGATNFDPGMWLIWNREELRRVQRDGSPIDPNRPDLCPLQPTVRAFCERAAQALMKTYGEHPAFVMTNINSEMRDNAQPCFHTEDIHAYRAATGLEIPPQVKSKHGTPYKEIAGFPADRIVADDHPLLTYFRWYWKQGDGWVGLNDLIHDTVKQSRPDVQTWFDPAVRVAPIYGSGGRLDMLGNWSYTNPDPIRVGMTAEELITMSRGQHKVFQMIQSIWYRSETAPKQQRAQVRRAAADPWDDHDPDADYFTPSPAHMTAASWMAISRPIDMLGYHGVGSLLPLQGGGYVFTHRDTADAIGRFQRRVVAPFGPMLRELGSRPADVALLESFSSQVFAGHGTFGWSNGTIGAFWLASQYAGLQSDIIYEETVLERGLDGYRVLIMPACEVLPRSVAERIIAFQQRGGIVIADELLAPGITPDIVIPHVAAWRMDGEPWKQTTLSIAQQMRSGLAGRYVPFAESQNPQVVLHTRERRAAGTQYLFAINDTKTFGDYVGRYGKVMEDGLPAETTITVQRSGVVVLDLVAGKPVAVESDGQATSFRAALEPGGGAIYVITEHLPARIELAAPGELMRAGPALFSISVVDAAGAAVDAVVPFEITIEDPGFHAAEPSGFYAAIDGQAQVTFDVAENDRTGLWRITAAERMTGASATLYVPMR